MAASSSLPVHDYPLVAERSEGGSGLAAGWALLQEAGDAIADLAQLGRDAASLPPHEFAMRAASAGPVRLVLIEQAIDDCAAALHYGLTALVGATELGRDCTAAALTLWREFDRARAALLTLAAPLALSAPAAA